MENNPRKIVTGMFRNRESAERAYKALEDKGYTREEINVIMSDDTRQKYFIEEDTELGSKALEAAGTGSAIGGTVGAIAGIIAAIGTNLVIPGLGLVIAGPIAAGFAGAGAGGITGGLIGGLIGAGIPEEHAVIYEKGIKDGHIVMGVKPRADEEAEHISQGWKNIRDGNIDR